MAIVIKEFYGHLETENLPRTFKVGEEIPEGSDLELSALSQGFCKKKREHRNKALGSAPVNKSASSRPAHRVRKRTRKSSKGSATK